MDKQEGGSVRRLSKIIMATGGIISMLAMCCLDSDGIYMYYAGAVCILGGFIAGAGYGLRVLSVLFSSGGQAGWGYGVDRGKKNSTLNFGEDRCYFNRGNT